MQCMYSFEINFPLTIHNVDRICSYSSPPLPLRSLRKPENGHWFTQIINDPWPCRFGQTVSHLMWYFFRRNETAACKTAPTVFVYAHFLHLGKVLRKRWRQDGGESNSNAHVRPMPEHVFDGYANGEARQFGESYSSDDLWCHSDPFGSK